MFALTESVLRRMWQRCNFEIPDHTMIFFGIRGLLPVDLNRTGFHDRHEVELTNVDYRHMRCALGQWKPGHGLALFPGSTVPSNNPSNPYISRARARGGFGTNQLMLGRYSHRKGKHGLNRPSGHKAFRQAEWFPVWRTSDDLDYDLDDFVDMNLPGRAALPIVWDNIHCGWSNGPAHPDYTSAGCQVVAGFPECVKRGNQPNTGPWKHFFDNAYGLDQNVFHYGLFTGFEAQQVAAGDGAEVYQSLRFNSRGALVKRAQELLNEKGFDVGTVDGTFGPNTLEGLMAFQRSAFGDNGDDGLLGPMTAEALGLSLPRFGEGVDFGIVPSDPDEIAVAETAIIRPDLDLLETDEPVAEEADHADKPKSIEIDLSNQNGWLFYHATDEAGRRISLGRRLKYGSSRGLGLRSATDAEALLGGKYDPEDFVDRFGAWAYFIWPTAVAESFGGFFNCFNCYDRAKFTYGFYQMAAHTPNDNLIVFFRRILQLPRAKRYFPDLELVEGKVHQRSNGSLKNLEEPHSDKLLRKFMNYLNPRANSVDEEEAVNVARLIFWSDEAPQLNEMQVQLAMELAQAKLGRAVKKGVPIESRPIWQAIWVNDNLHQGRASYAQLKSALAASNVDKAMSKVGVSEKYPQRIDTVRRAINDLEDQDRFEGMRFGEPPFVL